MTRSFNQDIVFQDEPGIMNTSAWSAPGLNRVWSSNPELSDRSESGMPSGPRSTRVVPNPGSLMNEPAINPKVTPHGDDVIGSAQYAPGSGRVCSPNLVSNDIGESEMPRGSNSIRIEPDPGSLMNQPSANQQSNRIHLEGAMTNS